MQFGKTEEENLDDIDFSLPADHPDNAVVLEPAGKKKPTVYIGCAKWGRKDWIGKLYPSGSKEKDFLKLYGKQFNSIELNPTHYNIPKPHIVQRWCESVPENFKFCPKVYQGISHWERLKDEKGNTDRFCDAIRLFGDRLGLVFLQLHPSFKPNNYETLETYLYNWPKDIPLSLELRDPAWFLDDKTSDRLFHTMRELQVTSVITDTAKFRNLVHMRLSTPQAFIRYVGNSLHPTDYQRIDSWVERIGLWLDAGLETLWFFMHQHEELYSPELIHYMAEEMNEKLGLSVKVPDLLS